MVVGQGLRPVAIGLAVGLSLSFVVGRAVSSLLYDVSTYDPLTLVGVVVAIGLVSLVAALGPARRATRLNPVAALRQE
jgi:ABC-type antimicrobial peptide transport system permease subunit